MRPLNTITTTGNRKNDKNNQLFLKYLNGREVNSSNVLEYLQLRKEAGHKPNYISKLKSSLKTGIKFTLLAENRISEYPEWEILFAAIKTKTSKTAVNREALPTPNELVKFLAKLPLRVCYFVLFTIATGVRSGEIVTIKLSDISHKTETTMSHLGEEIEYSFYQIKIWNQKNDSHKYVICPIELIDTIKAFFRSKEYLFEQYNIATNGVKPYAQRTYQNWLEVFCKQNPEFEVWPHLLRHLAGTMFWDVFKDPIVVSRILGNSPTVVMDVYAHPARDKFAELAVAKQAVTNHLKTIVGMPQ